VFGIELEGFEVKLNGAIETLFLEGLFCSFDLGTEGAFLRNEKESRRDPAQHQEKQEKFKGKFFQKLA
jgi:hypothetical protein